MKYALCENLRFSLFIITAAFLLPSCSNTVTIRDPSTGAWYDCDLERRDYPPGHPCYAYAQAHQQKMLQQQSTGDRETHHRDWGGPEPSYGKKDPGGSGPTLNEGNR